MIPFNKPYMTGKELRYIAQAHADGHLAGDGHFTKKCKRVARASHRQPQGSADAFVHCRARDGGDLDRCRPRRRGDHAVVHLRLDSQCFRAARRRCRCSSTFARHPQHRRDARSSRRSRLGPGRSWRCTTRALVCDDGRDHGHRGRHDLMVIEDAAQGIHRPTYKGARSAASATWPRFPSTRRRTSSQARAAHCSSTMRALSERAEIIREKRNESELVLPGQVDKYTWVDIGSSYLPGEIVAAFLWAQMEEPT